MNWLFVTLTVAIVIASVLLTIVVLLQNGKGDGLATNFVAANQAFGARQAADILEKVTWFLVAFILVLSIASSFTTGTSGAAVDVTEKIENAASTSQPAFPSAPISSEDPIAE